MATKREMAGYTVFFSVLGHKKFIHKILAKSESVRFQPLFKFFWCSQRIALKYHSNHHIFLNQNYVTFDLFLSFLAVSIYRLHKLVTILLIT